MKSNLEKECQEVILQVPNELFEMIRLSTRKHTANAIIEILDSHFKMREKLVKDIVDDAVSVRVSPFLSKVNELDVQYGALRDRLKSIDKELHSKKTFLQRLKMLLSGY